MTGHVYGSAVIWCVMAHNTKTNKTLYEIVRASNGKIDRFLAGSSPLGCVNRWALQRSLEPSSRWLSFSVAAVSFLNKVLYMGCRVCQQLRKYGNTFITYLICHIMPGSLCSLWWVVPLIFFFLPICRLIYDITFLLKIFVSFVNHKLILTMLSQHISQASIDPKVPMIWRHMFSPVYHC